MNGTSTLLIFVIGEICNFCVRFQDGSKFSQPSESVPQFTVGPTGSKIFWEFLTHYDDEHFSTDFTKPISVISFPSEMLQSGKWFKFAHSKTIHWRGRAVGIIHRLVSRQTGLKSKKLNYVVRCLFLSNFRRHERVSVKLCSRGEKITLSKVATLTVRTHCGKICFLP